MFGESSFDQRDYGFAFAALQCSMHVLRLMAEKGLVTPGDVFRVRTDAMAGIDIVPEGCLSPAGRQAIENTFEEIFSEATKHL